MKYRALTVGREYGSGGAQIAQQVADRLGWRVLDNSLISEAARRAQVDPALARRYDEKPDTWLHRIARQSLSSGALEAVAPTVPGTIFDSEALSRLAASLIREAHAQGNCVIVGRGAQCVLQKETDVFHVFVYGPRSEKAERLRRRFPEIKDVHPVMESTDRDRAAFVRSYFGCEWKNPHLYHLLISSALGIDTAAAAILRAMGAE